MRDTNLEIIQENQQLPENIGKGGISRKNDIVSDFADNKKVSVKADELFSRIIKDSKDISTIISLESELAQKQIKNITDKVIDDEASEALLQEILNVLKDTDSENLKGNKQLLKKIDEQIKVQELLVSENKSNISKETIIALKKSSELTSKYLSERTSSDENYYKAKAISNTTYEAGRSYRAAREEGKGVIRSTGASIKGGAKQYLGLNKEEKIFSKEGAKGLGAKGSGLLLHTLGIATENPLLNILGAALNSRVDSANEQKREKAEAEKAKQTQLEKNTYMSTLNYRMDNEGKNYVNENAQQTSNVYRPNTNEIKNKEIKTENFNNENTTENRLNNSLYNIQIKEAIVEIKDVLPLTNNNKESEYSNIQIKEAIVEIKDVLPLTNNKEKIETKEVKFDNKDKKLSSFVISGFQRANSLLNNINNELKKMNEFQRQESYNNMLKQKTGDIDTSTGIIGEKKPMVKAGEKKEGASLLDTLFPGKAGILGGIGGLLSKGKGGIGKILGGIGGAAGGVLGKIGGLGGKLGGAAGKAGGVLGKSAGGLAKMGGLAARGAGGALKALPVVGQIAMAGMAAYDGIKGWNKAGENFGLKEGEKATTGQKLSSATGSILSGLSFGLLDEQKMTKGIYSLGSKVTDPFKTKQTEKLKDDLSGGIARISEKNKIVSDVKTGVTTNINNLTNNKVKNISDVSTTDKAKSILEKAPIPAIAANAVNDPKNTPNDIRKEVFSNYKESITMQEIKNDKMVESKTKSNESNTTVIAQPNKGNVHIADKSAHVNISTGDDYNFGNILYKMYNNT